MTAGRRATAMCGGARDAVVHPGHLQGTPEKPSRPPPSHTWMQEQRRVTEVGSTSQLGVGLTGTESDYSFIRPNARLTCSSHGAKHTLRRTDQPAATLALQRATSPRVNSLACQRRCHPADRGSQVRGGDDMAGRGLRFGLWRDWRITLPHNSDRPAQDLPALPHGRSRKYSAS